MTSCCPVKPVETVLEIDICLPFHSASCLWRRNVNHSKVRWNCLIQKGLEWKILESPAECSHRWTQYVETAPLFHLSPWHCWVVLSMEWKPQSCFCWGKIERKNNLIHINVLICIIHILQHLLWVSQSLYSWNIMICSNNDKILLE